MQPHLRNRFWKVKAKSAWSFQNARQLCDAFLMSTKNKWTNHQTRSEQQKNFDTFVVICNLSISIVYIILGWQGDSTSLIWKDTMISAISALFRNNLLKKMHEKRSKVIWVSNLRLLQSASNFGASLQQKWSVILTSFRVLVCPAMVTLHAKVNDSYGNKIILGITKSSICLLYCSLASYSATCPVGMVDQFWTNSPLSVGIFSS